jgi:uncharacterized protein (TIGR02246 family)
MLSKTRLSWQGSLIKHEVSAMMRTRVILILAGLTTTCLLFVRTNTAVAADDAEITAIRQRAAAYIKALDKGDRATLAATWTPEGQYVDASGRAFKAQDLIAQEFGDRADGPRRTWRATVDRIRLITPDVATEDGTTQYEAAPGQATTRSRYTATWVKRDGAWMLDSLHESVAPAASRNTRLDELSWLLGEFAGQADDGTSVVVSSIISPDGNFMLRDLLVTLPDRSVHSLHSRIGWDPATGSFKSWVFDGDGSFGEGHWKRHGDNWLVMTTGVVPDGRPKSVINVYTQIGPDGFVVESVGSMVGNESRPSVKLQLTRVSTLE